MLASSTAVKIPFWIPYSILVFVTAGTENGGVADYGGYPVRGPKTAPIYNPGPPYSPEIKPAHQGLGVLRGLCSATLPNSKRRRLLTVMVYEKEIGRAHV